MSGDATNLSLPYTFLFTDIQGSTRLWEQIPDGMSVALRKHDAILRAAIEPAGQVFKTMGDAFHAAFRHPPDALRAAVSAQRTLQQESWEELEGFGPLLVRMAVHSGSAERSGGEFTGPALNRTARVLAAGHGGQILVTGSTVELLTTIDLPDDARLLDLGERRLRDIPGSDHLYQLSADGMSSTFPPLITLDFRPHNLPAHATSLVGREAEMNQLTDMLRSRSVRLVTLSGPGGVGKTRLALEAATRLVDDWQDGVWFVDLAPADTAESAISAIARVLRVREESERATLETVGDYIRERQLLLVIDNCEQAIQEIGKVAASLLAASPGLILVATSREPLRIRAERLVEVTTLSLPATDQDSSLETLEESSAVSLFVERATASAPGFRLQQDNASLIAEICRRLEGLPLAIELAAARLSYMTPAVLLKQLASRLAPLSGGSRDLPSRHQSLRAAISWSYDLLNGIEQQMFRAVSVFSGGIGLDAAIAVAPHRPEITSELDALEIFGSLLNKSLLVRVESAEEPRFRMLETIREFALEALIERNEEQHVHNRHAQFFYALSKRAGSHFRTAAEPDWMNRLDIEHDNLRGSLGWMLSRPHGPEDLTTSTNEDTPLDMAATLWSFWDQHGYAQEGKTWLERAFDANQTGDSLLRARVLRLLGNSYLHDPAKATEFYEESYRVGSEAGNGQEAMDALIGLAIVAMIQGNYEQALDAAHRYTEFNRNAGESSYVAHGLLWQGQICSESGEFGRAREFLDAALRLYRDLQYADGIAWVLLKLGQVERFEGNAEAADLDLASAFDLASTAGDQALTALIQREIGLVAIRTDHEVAQDRLNAALGEIRQWDEKREIVVTLEAFAELRLAENRVGEALLIWEAADDWRRSSGMPRFVPEQKRLSGRFASILDSLGESASSEFVQRASALSIQEICDIAIGSVPTDTEVASESVISRVQ